MTKTSGNIKSEILKVFLRESLHKYFEFALLGSQQYQIQAFHQYK